ncbi:cytochrome c/FTR1 family iron permease [Sphingomonas paucimobilis]|uniref:Cytochrome c/FTR1 family iron permease n=2 Tax=Sphingomonas paucimobilis TaxID=13689 RepID=A0A7T3AE60_SPHPI|nr:cytochrome c/FTR1 family iron permease [Sphingomonas paucimobilis]QPS14707.1 cytochrome c/FTR1 family iron permease [Sphingomonas paucimobilis]QPT11003.1 cytochrome c/FTR1 family iron permease [Sphingomonas paucimobilis]GAN15829.1 putative inon permease [Sphingomonas paucimobilis NBRC 13935]
MRALLVRLAAFLLALVPVAAIAEPADVQTAWRLLDYMAVDYGGAVADGSVKSAPEFAEMNEFAAGVSTRLRSLPANPERQSLIQRASQLQGVIARKGSPQEVAALAHGLAADLLAAYPVPLAPDKAPAFATGTQLFAQNCSSCHGLTGDGHGPDAAKLTTPPIAFTDAERARQRSVFALYQVITQGIDGTAMQSFADLPNDQRWALAFRAGSFALTDAQAVEGERLWKSDASLRARIPDLKTLVALTPAALAGSIGQAKADAVLAYLRRHPNQVMQQAPGSLAVARAKLAQSLAAFRRGDRPAAKELALSAYLDGFEPIEPTLSARDSTLMSRIEGAMGEYRAAVDSNASTDDAAERVAVLDSLFDDAEVALAPDAATEASTFLGAFTILLREGLEALLIVVAMIAFLRKAERTEALRYVHGGWVSALVAGALTWAVATYAIGISGASRELTEGFGSLFAAVVLLSVGIWMHGKAQADQWQRYIREKMSRALSGGSGWFLFGLAFVVVYREVFETILFYAALSTQGNNAMLLAGAGSAIGVLGVIAWAMLRYSRTLPITQFFRYSSWLMAGLTVVLAGKGVSALQEAGIIDIAPLANVPRLSMLGLFPTWQSVFAQLVMVIAIVTGFAWNRRKEPAAPARTA